MKVLAMIVTTLAAFVLFVYWATPRIPGVRPGTNSTSAVATLRTIAAAQEQYRQAYPERGYSCTLAALSGDPEKSPPGPESAQLLDPRLADGMKAGYAFNVASCSRSVMGGKESVTQYEVWAVPIVVRKTGIEGFCMDESGEIKFDHKGGTNCTETLY